MVSREIGVYGNREGSETDEGVTIFKSTDRGMVTIQSIIEDLIGMRKGDLVFFHVIEREEEESSVHGVYRVREIPFYNNRKKLWKSSSELVFPYRFCFEPHPQHTKLCRHDANIPVSEFYTSIEKRRINSIFTLEREVRGAAHAVKTITTEDAREIVELLYRDYGIRSSPIRVDFRPVSMRMQPLRKHIRRIGRIEFAIKALVAYRLGRRDKSVTKFLPACKKGSYDVLIENFIGQTMRRPADILCSGHASEKDSRRRITILEAKTKSASIDDLIQSLKYLDMFRLRNVEQGSLTHEMSICLLANRFRDELVDYVSIRNQVIDWENIILLRYEPRNNGKNADFYLEKINMPEEPKTSIFISRTQNPFSKVVSRPDGFYSLLRKRKPPKVKTQIESRKSNSLLLRKDYIHQGQASSIGHIFVYRISGECGTQNLRKFMNQLRKYSDKLGSDMMVLEPVIIAKEFGPRARLFIEEYNIHETHARRQPISPIIEARIR